MMERSDLLASIAGTIKDYRAGEIAEPTPQHVDRWVSQFGGEAQVPLLREMDYALKRTYRSRERVIGLLTTLAKHPPNRATKFPCSFWERAHIFDIQRNGGSQTEIRNLFGGILHYVCGLNMEEIAPDGRTFVYLDDALFSGNRIISDLSNWIPSAPQKATVYVCIIASHTGGEYWCQSRVEQIASNAGKDIDLRFWRFALYESRQHHRNQSDVLWPTADVYAGEGFQPRQPGYGANRIFSGEPGRQLLEREFLNAGDRIRGFANNPSPVIQPLGFSRFEPGFGALFVTYRNCPNNCPLALWYGDPAYGSSHPLGRWYPLLPRKTYQ